MVKISLWTWCLASLWVGAAWAQQPSSALEAPRGKVLILDNDRVMEGEIVQDGDHYRIRRGSSEISIPTGRARKLVGSLEEAYQYMKGQSPQADADERLKLAKWCSTNGLREQALAEARAAVSLRPNHNESKQFLRFLERAVAAPAQPAPAASEPLPPVPEIDVSGESFTLFVNKVQPVLLNTCGQCHSSNYTGKFQLFRAQEGGSRAATQRNLASALGQVLIEKPAFSPLLTKAVSNHAINKAMDSAPIKSRQAEPFRLLQAWVEHVVIANPHLREMKITAAAPQSAFLDQSMSITNAPNGPLPQLGTPKTPMTPTTPPVFAEIAPLPTQASVPLPAKDAPRPQQAPPTEAVSPPAFAPQPPVVQSAPPTFASDQTPKAPPAPTQPIDEFDPLPFNKKFHPER